MIKFWKRGCNKKVRELEKSFENLDSNLKCSYNYFIDNFTRYLGDSGEEEIRSEREYYPRLLEELKEMDLEISEGIEYYSYLLEELKEMDSDYEDCFLFEKRFNFHGKRAMRKSIRIIDLLNALSSDNLPKSY